MCENQHKPSVETQAPPSQEPKQPTHIIGKKHDTTRALAQPGWVGSRWNKSVRMPFQKILKWFTFLAGKRRHDIAAFLKKVESDGLRVAWIWPPCNTFSRARFQHPTTPRVQAVATRTVVYHDLEMQAKWKWKRLTFLFIVVFQHVMLFWDWTVFHSWAPSGFWYGRARTTWLRLAVARNSSSILQCCLFRHLPMNFRCSSNPHGLGLGRI